jgi:hypothetical protein
MEQFFDTKSVIDVRGDTHGKKENRLVSRRGVSRDEPRKREKEYI